MSNTTASANLPWIQRKLHYKLGNLFIYKLGKPLYKLRKAVSTNFGNSVSQHLGTVDAKIRFPSVKNSELTNVFHLMPGVVHA